MADRVDKVRRCFGLVSMRKIWESYLTLNYIGF